MKRTDDDFSEWRAVAVMMAFDLVGGALIVAAIVAVVWACKSAY